MANSEVSPASPAAAKAASTPMAPLTPEEIAKKRGLHRRKKAEGRKKRAVKLKTDKEFAKAFFEGRAKRSNDKKAAFRKKKSRKK